MRLIASLNLAMYLGLSKWAAGLTLNASFLGNLKSMIWGESGGQQSPPVGVLSPGLNPERGLVPHLEISGADIGAAPTDGTDVKFTAPARPPRPRRTFRRSRLFKEFSEEPALQEILCFSGLLRAHFFENNGQEEMTGEVVVKEEE